MQQQLDRLEKKLDDILHRIDVLKDQLDAIGDFLEKKPQPSAEAKTYVEIPDKESFRATCATLLRHPKMSDEKFIEALQSFPQTVDRYGRLTSGQWKFFGVIHNTALGQWPKTPQPLQKPVDPAGPAPYYDANDPAIPF